MNFTITDEIRKAIERDTGISYWRLSIMSDEMIARYVKEKTGKDVVWPDVRGIRTPEYIEKRLNNELNIPKEWVNEK